MRMTRISVTQYFSTIIRSLNERLATLCSETDSLFISGTFQAVEDPERPFSLLSHITRDGAHFNLEGYAVLGQAIVDDLRAWGVKPGSRVLLVGDSITAGYPEYEPLLLGLNYGDEEHSFGYHIRTLLNCDVVNCGISGDHTSSMVTRLATHLQVRPDVVILQGGANDAFMSMEMGSGQVTSEMADKITDTIFKNFRDMVEECKDGGYRCAVLPLLPFYGEFMQGE
jgi:lysophospholipase L1-like esterase